LAWYRNESLTTWKTLSAFIQMKQLLITLFIGLITIPMHAQETDDTLKLLTEHKQYKKIIEDYSKNYENLSAKALYYIGQAYYMLEEDQACLKFMDLSIQKNNQDPGPFFIKASTLNYMGKYDDAIKHFKEAIKLNPKDEQSYTGLGDAYYQKEELAHAAEYYEDAIKFPHCPERTFYMLGQTYSGLKDNKKALEAYYLVKDKANPTSQYYMNSLFNIGLLELMKKNYPKAEEVFKEIIRVSPQDCYAYSKLIQIYYHYQDYKKAEPLKEVLYTAYHQGKLKGTNLEDMFCIDQFDWKNYKVMAFERYENENKGKIYYKHLFYVRDENDKTVLRVQTEYSPISVELNGPAYLLCVNQDATHFNPGIGFSEDYSYKDIKSASLKLFEEFIK
jgi:tetratricopeptide (TPR) repeat protein